MSNNSENASDLHLPVGVVQELEAGMDRGSLPEGSASFAGHNALEAGTEHNAQVAPSDFSSRLSSRSEAEGPASQPAVATQTAEGAPRLAPETGETNARTATIDRNTTETRSS